MISEATGSALVFEMFKSFLPEPDKFDIERWLNRGGKCCGASRVLLMKGGKPSFRKDGEVTLFTFSSAADLPKRRLRFASNIAAGFMGIPTKQGKRLFFLKRWPKNARLAYNTAKAAKDGIGKLRAFGLALEYFLPKWYPNVKFRPDAFRVLVNELNRPELEEAVQAARGLATPTGVAQAANVPEGVPA